MLYFHPYSKLPSKVRREIAIGVGLVLPTVLAVLCVVDSCTKPPARVKYRGDRRETVVIDVATLAEYPTTIVRVRLTNEQTHAIIWEIKANSGTPQIWALTLREGENSVSLAEPETGKYTIVSPTDSLVFRLERGVRYKVELWGDTNSSPTHVGIRFG
jgi:hypothetical protein